MTKSIKAKFPQPALLLIFFALFCCLSGCGGSKDAAATGTGTNTTTTTAAYLNLLVSPRTVLSDGTTSTTITVSALNAAHAVVPDVIVTMSADTGILGAATITTGSDGTATVKFSCDNNNPINRTATITATAGAVSAHTLVQIVGSTITLTPTGTIGLSASGLSPVTLKATVSDAGGTIVPNTPIALTTTSTDSGRVTVTPASGTTNTSGQFTATVAGAAAGTVTLTVTALGTTATKEIPVSTSASSFAIDDQLLNTVDIGNPKPTAMKIGDQLAIEVSVPLPTTTVVFVTTMGSWVGGTTWIQVTVDLVTRKAIATLATTLAGIANVQVYDQTTPSTSDALTVAMASSAIANSIMLQATSNVVPISVGTTTGTSTLVATVRDATLPTGVLVAGAPVSFSILNPTGGGETIYPVVVMTGTDGKASTTFSSGSVSSDPAGVQIRASVVGTSVATGTDPSGKDASIIIGGTAGSVAFGQATVISENDNKTQYIYPMSILVADSSGHAVAGARISLSLWPIAWSTGTFCTFDPDNGTNKGTFRSEDINANLILDPGEDGLRIYYATGVPVAGGKTDGKLTPVNSEAGALPSGDIYTDASGVADFNLTFPKSSAIWTIVRMRASTIVQGSETVGEIIFRLPFMEGDVVITNGVVTTCRLPDSHYIF
jgi:hypothetical protein